jgi:hypothetical protein
MKKELKYLLTGLTAGVALTLTTSAFAQSTAYINVIFDKIALTIDGKPVKTQTILYNGTTYIPIRDAAETLGMTVNYNEASSTANLVTPKEEVAKEDEEIFADVSQLVSTNTFSDKSETGTREMTTTVKNITNYTLTSYSALYTNTRTGKSFTIRQSGTNLGYGESFSKVTTMPSGSYDSDLKLQSVTYTLSNGVTSNTITYNAHTDKYE